MFNSVTLRTAAWLILVSLLAAAAGADHPRTQPADGKAPSGAGRDAAERKVRDALDWKIGIEFVDTPLSVFADQLGRDTLLITSTEKAKPALETRTYPIDDIVRPSNGLAGGEDTCADIENLILTFIEPGSWEPDGATGVLRRSRAGGATALIVRHTPEVHSQIAQRLGALRRIVRQAEKGKLPKVVALRPTRGEGGIRRALERPVDLDCLDTPLDEFARQLGQAAGIRVALHSVELEDVGILPSEALITCRFGKVPLCRILKETLSEHDLTYVIQDGALLITTPECGESRLYAKAYVVDDLLGVAAWLSRSSLENTKLPSAPTASGLKRAGGPEAWVQLVRRVVQPDTWAGARGWGRGGVGRAAVVRLRGATVVAVLQTQQVHEEIARLFAMLRRIVRRAKQGKPQPPVVPATRRPSPEDIAIRKALAQTVSLDFDDRPLNEVARLLSQRFKIKVELDRRELEDVGVPLDTPVSIHLSHVSLESALTLMLRAADLTFVVADGVVLISSPETAEMMLTAAIYPVGDLVGGGTTRPDTVDLPGIAELIETGLQPDTWETVGGPGTIGALRVAGAEILVVRQYIDVHDELPDFLAALRRVDRQAGEGEPIAKIPPAGGSPADRRAQRKIERALRRRISLHLQEAPLTEMAAEMTRRCEITVFPDALELTDVGVDLDTPVSIEVTDVPAGAALEMILDRLNLTWIVDHEVLLVTTPEKEESCLSTRVYPVSGLVADGGHPSIANDGQQLARLVTAAVRPDSWDDAGGPGTIMPVRLPHVDALVVRQSQEAHREIAELLAATRAAAKSGGKERARAFSVLPLGTPQSRAAERAIRRTLKKRVVFHFNDKPLTEFAKQIEADFGIRVAIDRPALKEWEIDAESPVSAGLPEITARRAIRWVLRELDLTYDIRDGVLRITTPEMAEMRLATRLYPVDDLAPWEAGSSETSADAKGLAEVILDTVQPDSWDRVGGLGTLAFVPVTDRHVLAVRQTDEAHDDVAALLRAFRRVPARVAKGNHAPVPADPITSAEKATRKTLQKRVTLQFDDKPLSDVVHLLREKYGLPVVLDRRELEDVGVKPETAVSLHADDVPLDQALKTMLAEQDLTYIVDGELLLVTSPEKADNMLSTWLYPVGDLLPPHRGADDIQQRARPLMWLLTSNAQPDTWQGIGGPGTVEPFRAAGVDVLVIRQTRDVHEEITTLLRFLRRLARNPARQRGHVTQHDPYASASERRAGRALRKALAAPVTMQFDTMSLQKFVQSLKEQCGIEAVLDTRKLADLGVVPSQSTVSFHAAGVPARAVLDQALRQHRLGWLPMGGKLLITSAPKADNRMMTRIYGLGDLVAPSHVPDLIETILRNVQPDAWPEVGGTIVPFRVTGCDMLSMFHTRQAHEELVALLDTLRRLPARAARGDYGPVTPDPVAASEIRIQRALKQESRLHLDNTPLSEVARLLNKKYGLPVVLDTRDLAEIGVGPETKLSRQTDSLPLEVTLRRMFANHDFMYRIDGGVLLITGPEEAQQMLPNFVDLLGDPSCLGSRTAEERLLAVLYPVGDLLPPKDGREGTANPLAPLTQLLTKNIAPDTWQDAGGPGTIVSLRAAGVDVLAIRQSRDVHEEIAALLRALRHLKPKHTISP